MSLPENQSKISSLVLSQLDFKHMKKFNVSVEILIIKWNNDFVRMLNEKGLICKLSHKRVTIMPLYTYIGFFK